ncbi:MAG: HAD-IIB family hydrolase [Gammaproteobacteria bacterium]|nr:HAD-IIB family hydrolase [Gammaproteobacteria bacterium]
MHKGRYLILVSVHGLVRGQDLELGRDADTGGQIKYVVELARALAKHSDVWRVDVLTRQVIDPKVSADYAERLEPISDGAFIVRLPCGPRRYLRKEVLWPYLDSFTDHALQHVRRIGRLPDVVHSHYADAGYVGSRLSALLGVPLVHTGHSLGREKRRRLLEHGQSKEAIETQYNMSQRIEAEELALDHAQRVIASTQQEVDEQYAKYANYQIERMEVIAPGVDLERFHPPSADMTEGGAAESLKPFLRYPERPQILALSRADERKNIATLLRAYGEHPTLRNHANLVVIAGNRTDLATLDRGARTVLTDMLLSIDRYDLYGHIAYPKHHSADDVPEYYRNATRSRGIFVNPALTEPFGLTLLEAAASGLPVLATRDGGPRDILRLCRNGRLIDPLNAKAMGRSLAEMLRNPAHWTRWSENGIAGVDRNYSWAAHVQKYLKVIDRLQGGKRERKLEGKRSRMPTVDRLIVTALDNTLLGNAEALHRFARELKEHDRIGFGIATGRSLQSALDVIARNNLPQPDLLITSVGAEIHYGHQMVVDQAWARHIDYRWELKRLRAALRGIPGLKLQAKADQHPFKLSYFCDPAKAPKVRELVRMLRENDLHANVTYSRNMFLDLLPIRASKGLALRYICGRWGIMPDNVLVAGSCGSDEELLRGNTLGVVVANYSTEIERMRNKPRIYFSAAEHAAGVLEGIQHYNFLGDIRLPDDEEMAS